MKFFFGVMVIFGLLLLAGAGMQLLNPTEAASASSQELRETPQALVQVVEPSAEPPPSETPAPTSDAYVTSTAAMLDAAATNAHAIGIQATAIVEAAAINERTAAIEATRSAQESNNAIVLQNAQNAEKSIDATAAAQVVLDEIALANVKIAQDRVLADTVLSVTVFLLAGGIIAALIIRALRPVSVGASTADGQDHDLPAYPGGMDIRQFVPSIPADVLLKVARAYVAGTPFTHEGMTPAYISEGLMYTLQHLMVKHGGATWRSEKSNRAGCKVNERGERFFRDLATLPPPPPERRGAENVSAREADTIRQSETPEGEGWRSI